MPKRQLKYFILAFPLLMTIIFAGDAFRSQRGEDSIDVAALGEHEAVAETANCRYGVYAKEPQDVTVVSRVGAGWYMNSQPYEYSTTPSNGASFGRLIWMYQNRENGEWLPTWTSHPKLNDAFASFIKANPGEIYQVGNEVDRYGQGQMLPEMYAEAYHKFYTFIKSIDPTAQIANSGLVQVTPMRMQYLDLVWDAYLKQYGSTMPVDIWNMHLYPLPEVVVENGELVGSYGGLALGTDPELGNRKSNGSPSDCQDPYDNIACEAEYDNMQVFADQVLRMRQWMKDHGEQNKPLLLSEFSILPAYYPANNQCWRKDEFGRCFDPARVNAFLNNTFSYLKNAKSQELGYPLDDYRMIQSWWWFSIYRYPNTTGSSSNLILDDRQNLSLVGTSFRDRVAAEAPYHNLVIEDVPNIVIGEVSGGTATSPISVSFRNNGNSDIRRPFEVTFYADSGLTRPIGSARFAELVRGCTTSVHTATVEWSELTLGDNPFWAVLDSKDEIAENPAGNGDNVGKGMVTVTKGRTMLPIVRSN
ncbi:MAG: hypothetical protein ACK2UK_19305 [Candidatus Promineifilaceae bacterium]